MAPWVIAFVAVGVVIAGILLARRIASFKRAASAAGVDPHLGRGDRQPMRLANRPVVHPNADGVQDPQPEHDAAEANAPYAGLPALISADREPQLPGTPRQDPQPPDLPISTAAEETSLTGEPPPWTYYGPGGDDVAGSRGDTRHSSLRPNLADEGHPPPKVTAKVRKIVSDLTTEGYARPEDFARLAGKSYIPRMADTANHAPHLWLLVSAMTDDDTDLTGDWTIVVGPGPSSAGTAPQAREPGSTDQPPPGHVRPDPAHRARTAPRQDSSHSGRSQTVILLDAAALDTLIAALLGPVGSHGLAYSETISVIKICLQPRMLVIKSVTMTVGAILNAHGLGVLAPASGRIITKVLIPALNLVLGVDSSHARLMTFLDGLDIGLNTANGWPTDAPEFRSKLSDWMAGAPGAGPPPRPHAPSQPSSTPNPNQPPWTPDSERTHGKSGEREEQTTSPRTHRPDTGRQNGPVRAPSPSPPPDNEPGQRSRDAGQGLAPSSATMPTHWDSARHTEAGSADPKTTAPTTRSQELPPRSDPGPPGTARSGRPAAARSPQIGAGRAAPPGTARSGRPAAARSPQIGAGRAAPPGTARSGRPAAARSPQIGAGRAAPPGTVPSGRAAAAQPPRTSAGRAASWGRDGRPAAARSPQIGAGRAAPPGTAPSGRAAAAQPPRTSAGRAASWGRDGRPAAARSPQIGAGRAAPPGTAPSGRAAAAQPPRTSAGRAASWGRDGRPAAARSPQIGAGRAAPPGTAPSGRPAVPPRSPRRQGPAIPGW